MKVMTDVIIGAGSGMGAAVAKALAGRQRPLVLADRDAKAAAEVARGLDADVEVVRCDIADATDVANLVERVGPLSALVLTAGLSPNMGDGRHIYTVNLVAADAVVRAFEPVLQPSSVAVCFASSAAYSVPPNPAIDALLV